MTCWCCLALCLWHTMKTSIMVKWVWVLEIMIPNFFSRCGFLRLSIFCLFEGTTYELPPTLYVCRILYQARRGEYYGMGMKSYMAIIHFCFCPFANSHGTRIIHVPGTQGGFFFTLNIYLCENIKFSSLMQLKCRKSFKTGKPKRKHASLAGSCWWTKNFGEGLMIPNWFDNHNLISVLSVKYHSDVKYVRWHIAAKNFMSRQSPIMVCTVGFLLLQNSQVYF